MSWIEQTIAELGIVGVLLVTLTISILVNIWQFNRAGKAEARCESRITALQESARKIEADREANARRIASTTRREAIEAQNATIATTQERAERVRIITRTITVPAGCPVALPDSVQDELRQAVRAANG